MEKDIPISKWRRGYIGSKTAVKVGSKAISYFAKKPFLSKEKRQQAKADLDRQSAQAIYKAMSMLRGTALKIAQQISIESEIFPEAIRKEMQKAYNQVPPIDQAHIREIILNSFGRPPEDIFRLLEPNAFAAASLGQVHRGISHQGNQLAVKIQYPGIQKTITNDIKLLRQILRPLPEYKLILLTIEEVEKRLIEEINYHQEADHIEYFSNHFNLDGIVIPEVYRDISSDCVLSLSYLDGVPIYEWLAQNPCQEEIDIVAQRLQDQFLYGLYDLRTIHADPNPGNFLVMKDLTIGMVDFGCIKKLDPQFVENYRQLPYAAQNFNQKQYIRLLKRLKLMAPGIAPDMEAKVSEFFIQFGRWFNQLYQDEKIDFAFKKDFMKQGMTFPRKIYEIRKYIDLNPNIVFLDRTRFGLIRLYERMNAKVMFRNPYEQWC